MVLSYPVGEETKTTLCGCDVTIIVSHFLANHRLTILFDNNLDINRY